MGQNRVWADSGLPAEKITGDRLFELVHKCPILWMHHTFCSTILKSQHDEIENGDCKNRLVEGMQPSCAGTCYHRSQFRLPLISKLYCKNRWGYMICHSPGATILLSPLEDRNQPGHDFDPFSEPDPKTKLWLSNWETGQSGKKTFSALEDQNQPRHDYSP